MISSVFVILAVNVAGCEPYRKIAMTYDSKSSTTTTDVRNMISFWIFGMCNNFGFSVMLSAAQDILNRHERSPFEKNVTDFCVPAITSRICSPTSAGVVLLCNILPALLVKLMCPFVMHRIPYGIRHFVICSLQVTSLLVTAFAESVPAALIGVCVASVAGGFGETTYLGLAGHYSKHTIATWSSGTGMAGLAGAFSYAGMTDARLLALTSTQAMLVMLVVPAVFAFTQSEIKAPPSATDVASVQTNAQPGLVEQLKVVKLELTVFDCSHGYGTSPASQYRWYQVMYQTGAFISRSSLKLVQFNMTFIALMPLLQVDPSIREFALSTVSLADTLGILVAALTAIPLHNAICAMQWYG
ncbi:CLN3 protein [Teladorsagia circumcincta]|uniref:Battenin n=1 Tax=Teladorsagia circumcincta TaxID=45464 RepID=A0A2G9TS81_TELCI|nr:CLN3 protein [Teladorsagia circumcincta]